MQPAEVAGVATVVGAAEAIGVVTAMQVARPVEGRVKGLQGCCEC